MERKTLLYWLAQFGGWGAYFVFSILLLISTGVFVHTFNLDVWVASSIVSAILISHAIRYFIVRFDWLNFKLGKLIIVSITAAIVASVLLEAVQYMMEKLVTLDYLVNEVTEEEQAFDLGNFIFGVTRSMILFMLWMGFYYVFVIIEKSRKQEILSLQWTASKNEIELKNLRAQLNPHFLFNSLNSIRALVGLDPEQAKSAITKLSGLLRHSINLGKMQVVSLRDELDLVRSYLELEEIRFEERLKVRFDIQDSALDCSVPPLMLQTIVENAIKHGISQSIDGGEIIVKAALNDRTLQIEVANTGKLNQSETSNGVGLVNTERRLKILYEDKSDIKIQQDGEFVRVLINITYE